MSNGNLVLKNCKDTMLDRIKHPVNNHLLFNTKAAGLTIVLTFSLTPGISKAAVIIPVLQYRRGNFVTCLALY